MEVLIMINTCDRRQFIKRSLIAGSLAMMPFPIGKRIGKVVVSTDRSHQKDALIKAVREIHFVSLSDLDEEVQEEYLYDIENVELKNMGYAFDKIEPRSHAEYCFVVRCGLPGDYRHYVDEYVRRRMGMGSILPDHPFLALKDAVVPDMQRILAFNEQIISVILMLEIKRPYEIWRRFRYKQITREEFVTMVNLNWNDILSYLDIIQIYDAVNYYSQYAYSYFFCSALVQRAIGS
jgi:hypothetical protein